jgi:hypothetical protein
MQNMKENNMSAESVISTLNAIDRRTHQLEVNLQEATASQNNRISSLTQGHNAPLDAHKTSTQQINALSQRPLERHVEFGSTSSVEFLRVRDLSDLCMKCIK